MVADDRARILFFCCNKMKILTKCVFLTKLGPNSSIMTSIKKVMYIHLSKFPNYILLSVLGAVYVTVREKVICQNILTLVCVDIEYVPCFTVQLDN